MKMKYLILVTVIIMVSLTGCKKIAKLTQFEMEYNETVVIPASTGINLPFNLLTPEVNSNSESTFGVNNTRKDLIKEIKLTKLDLTITTPPNGDLDFLKSIEIYMVADGLTEQKIAWKDNIPDGVGNYLELETTDSDLKEFIKKDAFKLRISTVTDKVLTSDHHIDVHSVFFVDASILKL